MKLELLPRVQRIIFYRRCHHFILKITLKLAHCLLYRSNFIKVHCLLHVLF